MAGDTIGILPEPIHLNLLEFPQVPATFLVEEPHSQTITCFIVVGKGIVQILQGFLREVLLQKAVIKPALSTLLIKSAPVISTDCRKSCEQE